MSIAYFVDGRRVDPCAPGHLVSAEAVAELHGEDFVRSFGAEMFRRLTLDQQAAVIQAWSDAYSSQITERIRRFKLNLHAILEIPDSPEADGI